LSVDERLSLTQQAAQREAAYYQQMNAQILNETKQTSERLASVLESFFKDPMGTIKKQAEHMMAENMAAMLLQLTSGKGQFSSGLARFFGFSSDPNNPSSGVYPVTNGDQYAKMLSGSDHPGTLAKLLGTGGNSQALSVPATQLSYAGSTLGTAGSVLIAAAADLSAASATIGRRNRKRHR
jgi:hypothetical protein